MIGITFLVLYQISLSVESNSRLIILRKEIEESKKSQLEALASWLEGIA